MKETKSKPTPTVKSKPTKPAATPKSEKPAAPTAPAPEESGATLTVRRQEFQAALQAVAGALNSGTIPILGYVLLCSGKKSLTVTATDLDITIRAELPAVCYGQGSVCLPGHRVAEIVRNLSGTDVELEFTEKSTAILRCETARYNILGLAAGEFPSDPDTAKESLKFTIPEPDLLRTLKLTSFATHPDANTEHILSGVYFELGRNTLTATATSRNRLANITVKVECGRTGEAIIPKKVVLEIMRLACGEGNATVEIGENTIKVSTTGGTVWGKLSEGKYPNYKQLLDGLNPDKKLEVSREPMLMACRRVQPMLNEKQISARFTFTKSIITVLAETAEFGRAKESVLCSYKGSEFTIAFNPALWCDVLSVLECDNLEMRFLDDLSPLSMHSESFAYIIMPMQLS